MEVVMPEITSDTSQHEHILWEVPSSWDRGPLFLTLFFTRRESAPQGYSITIFLALHGFMFSLIGVLGGHIQLKFPDVSAYTTAYGTVMMGLFIIETCLYIVSLVVMGILAARNNTDFEDLMNNICLLLGSLSLIIELLVLVSPFGWIALFVWSICLLCFLSKSYKSLKILYQRAVAFLVPDFGELKQNLVAALDRAYQTLKVLIIRNDGRITGHEAQNQNQNHTTERFPV